MIPSRFPGCSQRKNCYTTCDNQPMEFCLPFSGIQYKSFRMEILIFRDRKKLSLPSVFMTTL